MLKVPYMEYKGTCRLEVSAIFSYSASARAMRQIRSCQRRLDTRHRTRDYFAFQWPLIDFCAYETGVDHAK